MRRIRRRKMFFDVRSASGPPATSTCGCTSMPKWMLAFGTSMPIGAGGGANGTYGLSDVASGAAGAAGLLLAAGTGASAASGLVDSSDLSDLGWGLPLSCSTSSPVLDDDVCANARNPGSNSAATARAATRWLSFMRRNIARIRRRSPVKCQSRTDNNWPLCVDWEAHQSTALLPEHIVPASSPQRHCLFAETLAARNV